MSNAPIAKFEKISKETWLAVHAAHTKNGKLDAEFENELILLWDNIRLPERATVQSAGYDIFTPVPVGPLQPGQGQVIPTGLRVKIEPGWVMVIMPKSRHIQYRLGLDNTVGIIDADYYDDPTNMIYLCISNNLPMVPMINAITRQPFFPPEQQFVANPGDAVMQAIFLPFGLAEEATPPSSRRTGGFGSTGNNNPSIIPNNPGNNGGSSIIV